ncbi:FAD-dependent oxidoreductase [Marihabitans asiaticum]|uniref:NAD(P)/FAD-dependent oxidoreductase n=1 Tax=Marihabitans asiaticum TaxID=415218 RepID=UPI001479559F|nr:FAD-dependent oxidoreductase [Marihabitans asiaticum]
MVIVGAGEAGARVAHELASHDWPGPITLLGAEDRPVYERPPLSKETVVADDPRPVEPYRERPLRDQGVQVRSGVTVTTADTSAREVGLSTGDVLGYDRLVLATGARARRVPGLPASVPTLRTYDDALALRAGLRGGTDLLVVGGGLIGLELAAAARGFGLAVTVVEAGSRVLQRAVPDPVAEELAARHEREGVDLRLSTSVDAVAQEGDRWVVTLSDGSVHRVDVLVQAVGSVPEVGLAESAGLVVADGIVVDEQLRASADGVWAVGDCCRGPIAMLGRDGEVEKRRVESWRMAHDQAVVAAAAIRGEDAVLDAVPWFWSDQYDLSLQVSGVADAARRWVARPEPDGSRVHLGLDDADRLVCAAGAGRAAVAKDVRKAERIIRAGTPVDPAALVDPALPLRPSP